MNKTVKSISIIAIIVGVIAASVAVIAACKKKYKKNYIIACDQAG